MRKRNLKGIGAAKQSGMTLLEIIVMLFIMGILAAGGTFISSEVVPAALQYHYVSKTRAVIETARTQARSAGRSVYVSAQTGGVAVCWSSPCIPGAVSAPVLDDFGDAIGFAMPNAWLYKDLPAAAEFKEDGSTTGWTAIRIGDATIDLDADTGRIK
ncbi:type II secretion system protein [Dechloromonas sp. ARDL1]|uniref:type II secretion system protein n=1 Tax=Dechloromonas sp. ARDL1 TaxID=3322121 RepID=UPI003DA77B28